MQNIVPYFRKLTSHPPGTKASVAQSRASRNKETSINDKEQRGGQVKRTQVGGQTKNKGQRSNHNNQGNQYQKRNWSPEVEVVPYVNEFGDQIYNLDGSRRTMRRRKDNRNTQQRTYSVHSYATNVKEDETNKDNKQNRGYGKVNQRDRGGVIRSSWKESARIKKLRATQKDPDFPAECVQKPLTQIC